MHVADDRHDHRGDEEVESPACSANTSSEPTRRSPPPTPWRPRRRRERPGTWNDYASTSRRSRSHRLQAAQREDRDDDVPAQECDRDRHGDYGEVGRSGSPSQPGTEDEEEDVAAATQARATKVEAVQHAVAACDERDAEDESRFPTTLPVSEPRTTSVSPSLTAIRRWTGARAGRRRWR